MIKNIYGMKVEHTKDREPHLVFSKDCAWNEMDLIVMEKKMLMSYPLTRIVPLQIKEMNTQITLIYKPGRKKSLSQNILNQALSEAESIQILSSIVTTIIESKTHLLNEERYLIDESLIYIGMDYLDVNLIYLPLYDLADKQPLRLELIKLVTKLLNTQSNNAQRILNSLKEDTFQLVTLKGLLFQLITEVSSQPIIKEFQPLLIEETWFPPTAKERINNLLRRRSHNPILVTCCVVLIIFVVCLYLIFPSAGMLNLSLGLSILFLNIGYGLNGALNKMDTGELAHDSPYGHSVQYQASTQSMSDYYQHLAEQTTLLMPQTDASDATVLLTAPIKAILEFKEGEEIEMIKISGDSFIIGRSIEAAQFTLNWIGLSRTHLEITRQGNEYEIKDLGSKNGSFLNEASMVPHQTYPLNVGDCIKVVEKQLIYKKL